MAGQPPDRWGPHRPPDPRSAIRRLLSTIVGAMTFTVLMFHFDLACNSENAACANFGEDPFSEVR
jgi:hypothetical protein